MNLRKLVSVNHIVLATLVLLLAFGALAPQVNAQSNVTGKWSTLSYTMPINPIHSALLPNGKILVVAGSGNCPPNQVGCPLGAPYGPSNGSGALLLDPVTGTITQFSVSWDMFCNGMVLLPDGRALINGGTIQYDPFFGQPASAIFDPASNTFTNAPNMAHGRWYPTLLTLGDGRIMTFSGLTETGGTNDAVEIYSVGAGWSTQFIAPWTPPLYPRMHLLPNGKVFYSGSTTSSALFDPSTNSWTQNVANTNYCCSRTYGTSVLLPLTPSNSYDPKVIILGGNSPATNTTEIIDMGASSPAWAFGPNMSQARIEMNAVILPNGKVLAVGGSVNDEDTSSLSLNADLYDPGSNTFSSAGANASERLYHSVALLLPDATVWLAGGNPTRGTYNNTVEVYQPAYLFNSNGSLATRPTITNAPSSITYSNNFSVTTPDAANISSVVLVRNGTVTHAFGMDQREVGLSFTAGSGTLTVTPPPNGNIAPPGYYMLFLLNSSGVPSVASFVEVENQIPPPPTNVTATAGNGQVGLSWSASSGATSYNVKRSTTSGGPYTAIASPTTTGYTDTGLTNGTTYYYVVSAVNASGQSANSSQVSATPLLVVPPPPTNVTATAGTGQVGLSWSASFEAISYNVKRSTTNGGPYTTIASPATTSYTDNGVTNGTTYYYVVSAVNTAGESANSSQVSATPTAFVINYGSGFTSSGMQLNGSTTLSGTRLRLTDGGSGEASSAFYTTPVNVQSFTTNFSFQMTSAAADGMAFVIQNGAPTTLGQGGGSLGYEGVTHSVAVKFDIFSNAGEGTDSTGMYVNGATPTVPAVDMTSSGVSLLSGDVMNVQLSYDGTTLTLTIQDAVTLKSFTTSWAVDISPTVGSTTALVGFSGGTGGLSAIQDVLSWTYGTGSSTNPPPVPTNVVATAGNGQVGLSWSASSGATSYNVKRSTTNGGPYTTIASPTTTGYTDTGVTNGTTYYYVVSAVNAAGQSTNSSQVSATPQVSVPPPPTNLVATAGNAQVALSWSASSGATSYNVKRSTTNGGPYTTIGSPTTTGYTDTGVTNGTTYYYVVSAVNTAGESANSSQVSATPQAVSPPPTNLAATAGNGQVGLSWSASSGATSYNVKRSTTNGGPYTTIASPTTTGYTDTGLTNGTTYYYVVSAVNTSGESANSIQVSATPQVAAPPPPTNLTATAGNGQVGLSWNASSGATSYNVKRATTSGGPYTTIASPTTTGYTDTGVTNGTTYYYVVSAVDTAGESANSSQVSATPATSTTVINYSGGFTSSGLQLNGNTTLNGTRLRLTDGGSGEASSAFYTTPVNVQSFTTNFSFQMTSAAADGMAFVIQNGAATTLGTGGGSLGYEGMTNSVAVKFDIFSNAGEGTDSTGMYVDGAMPTVPAVDMTSSGVSLLSGDVMNVQLSYDGTTLTLTIQDAVTLKSFTTSWTVNIPTTVGSTTALVGFTGGTGGLSAIQDVLNWTYGTGSSTNPPPVPTNVVTTAGNGQVGLSWSASSGATSYNVKRSTTNGGPYTTIASPTTAGYTDTGLTNGTTYYYVVSAVNSAGQSGNSSQVSATPQAVPPPPTNLVATAGNAQVGLSWSASSGATSYNVKRSTTNGGPYTTIASPTTTSYTDTGLTNGTTYYYVVSAVNSAGQSANSSQVSATPQVAVPPPPTNLVATAGNAQVGLSWSASSGATSYNVKRSTTNGGPYTTIASPATTSYTDTGLTNGTTYYYVVSAVNTSGESANSSQVSATPQVTVPPPPTNLVATAGNAQVGLSWSASSGATSYNVKRSTTNGGPYTTIASPATTSYTDTGLTNGTTYYYVVSAVNAAGQSANSSQVSATPQVAVPPPPTNLTATAGNGQVGLSWSTSSGATSYNVKRSTTNGGPYTTIASPTTTGYTDTGLTNGTTYYYVVSAVNASGESANSSQVSATPKLPIPPPPTNLTATAGNKQVVLSWSASSGATSYNVKRSTTNGGPYTTIASPTTPNYTNTGLTNGTTYYYVVSAVNASGQSANSSQVSATPQVAVPPPPTNVTATAGNAQVGLSWSASSGATSYNVKRATTSGGPYTTIASPTTTSYTNTGLTNGTTYYYVVSAVNTSGESANSSQVSATPQVAVPPPPTNLTATAGNGQVRLSWSASSGATSYNVKRSTTNGGPYTTIASPTTTGYTDSGLTNGTTYYYVVSAVNTAGESANSSQVSATPAASVINYGSGFTSSGLQLNGSTTLNGTRLRLTDGGSGEGSSAFYTTPVNVQSFTTNFSFQMTSATADGMMFVIQNGAATTLGTGGGSLGYEGITHSVAVKFDIFSNAGEGTDSTGMYVNGAMPTVPAVDMTSSGVSLLSGDVMNVQLSYNGTTLTLSIQDATTLKSFTTSWTVNIPTTVGSTTALVGFTGGTGGLTAIQDVLSWTYSN